MKDPPATITTGVVGGPQQTMYWRDGTYGYGYYSTPGTYSNSEAIAEDAESDFFGDGAEGAADSGNNGGGGGGNYNAPKKRPCAEILNHLGIAQTSLESLRRTYATASAQFAADARANESLGAAFTDNSLGNITDGRDLAEFLADKSTDAANAKDLARVIERLGAVTGFLADGVTLVDLAQSDKLSTQDKAEVGFALTMLASGAIQLAEIASI